jgi:hypothetical protein
MKITPALKGLITSALMIAIFIGIYYAGKHANPNLQYLVYITYILGIIWTVTSYSQSTSFVNKFGAVFNQGFRCFIVVTLLIALFYGIFNYLHPEFAEETSKAYREQLIDEKQTLSTDLDLKVETFKKQYITRLVSGAVFTYLIFGAVVTAAASAFLTRRK